MSTFSYFGMSMSGLGVRIIVVSLNQLGSVCLFFPIFWKEVCRSAVHSSLDA